jgi:hypothetical protein
VDRAEGCTDRKARLVLAFNRIEVGGKTYPLTATVTRASEKMETGLGDEKAKLGVGTGLGTILGAVIGGKKGAVIGAVLGGSEPFWPPKARKSSSRPARFSRCGSIASSTFPSPDAGWCLGPSPLLAGLPGGSGARASGFPSAGLS